MAKAVNKKRKVVVESFGEVHINATFTLTTTILVDVENSKLLFSLKFQKMSFQK